MDVTESLVDEVQTSLIGLAHEYESRTSDAEKERYRQNPFRNWSYRIYRLQSTLEEVRSALNQVDALANSRLMVLNGEAGTGKTHLLCDIAQRRVELGYPTILLMGQRFLGSDEPWSQALQHLDMGDATVEQFVGALEVAAQAANNRAVVIIDALNEGKGREMWPVHLPSFLARLEKSEWIAVVLAVRSTYEQVVIPPEVKGRAVQITHHGFLGEEYNATQSFFSYYNLEFPSAPILQPEYRNPLFLKTICEGLRHKGQRRLPRGFHGISAVFDLYLEAVNERLSMTLDYNSNQKLVQRALGRVAKQIVEANARWLSSRKIEQTVNELLPSKGFSASLYGALIAESVLIEYVDWHADDDTKLVVSIAFDRFADHLVTDYLLRTYLDKDCLEVAFAEDGPLALLYEDRSYDSLGLLEALSIQIPERTGKELLRIAPKVLDDPNVGLAFLQSIVWRRLDAFSEDTHVVLNAILDDKAHLTETLDSMLTVSTIPGHSFNADNLDRVLRQYTMPDRDAWWSTYLHHAWNTNGPVDRLVDWASSLEVDDAIATDVVDLAATTLAWMLTTSNRFLRDRATKALVSLLTGRVECTTRLVARFSDVDDPYVTERVYAVAYGVAMRSHDAPKVDSLASVVYKKVFASGTPPVHILLRDYARNVVERAIHLGSKIRLNEKLIRPPYNSEWPDIPSEGELESLTPNLNRGAWDGGDLEWSRNRIRRSVMSDDFAIYVIGANGGSTSWLSVGLDEDAWQSPDERLQSLVSSLSKDERSAWAELWKFKGVVSHLRAKILMAELREGTENAEITSLKRELNQAEVELSDSVERFTTLASNEHQDELSTLLAATRDHQARTGPRFDPHIIQRYILWRVFDLGWTIERFGAFDRSSIGYSGREAAKPERIGKKYQWIAYHEMLAYITDHYQYRERFEGGLQAYEGPWQESIRNIDPSSTLPTTPGGTSWGPHNPSWWCAAQISDWRDGMSHGDWVIQKDGLPKIEELMLSVRPHDDSRWLNVRGLFVWRQPHPADVEPFDIDRRELWIECMGYLVGADAADEFMDWAIGVDFWGRWMPEEPEMFGLLLGEHGWSPAFNYLMGTNYGGLGWSKPEGCPAAILPIAYQYHAEASSFDCSVDESYSLRLPHHELVHRLGLSWSGKGADYLDQRGQLAAFDPTAHEVGPTTLLIREDMLREYLCENDLALCWTILGEKRVLSEMGNRLEPQYHGSLKMTGAYRYTEQGSKGFISFHHDKPRNVSEV